MNIEISVDRRTELLGILLLISDYNKDFGFLIEECGNKEYREKIFNNFNQFKNDGIIPVNIDPHFYPSGRDVLILFTLGDLKYGKVISSNEEQKSSDINIPELEELKVRR